MAMENQASSIDALIALAALTALVVVSVVFEALTERLREAADEALMPFVHAVFSELTTLGFLGLLLFVVAKLDLLPELSRALVGEPERLQETVEALHMALFGFVVIFLVLCCALLRLGVGAQGEWRAFEGAAADPARVVAEYVVATEPPRSWREALAPARWRRAARARRGIVYVSLRQRFVDFRSNHPDAATAKRLAKEFQLDAAVPFAFDAYLAILSGEAMTRLVEIDAPTWIVLEACVVVVAAVSWQLGEVWTLLGAGFCLVALNDGVYRRIVCMRRLLTPTRLEDDAERLRRSDAWRVQHGLPTLDDTNSLLEPAARAADDQGFAPPYALMAADLDGCSHVSELALARRQRRLLGGGKGNGVRLAIFSTRLVFLLTALHLAVFLLRTSHQIHALDAPWLAKLALGALFLAPSVLVTGRSVDIARDGLYAFSVEHLKVHRVVARVMRLQRARRTLRMLRFVAEMKVYLREAAQRELPTGRAPSVESVRSIALAKSTSGSFRRTRSHAAKPSGATATFSTPPPLTVAWWPPSRANSSHWEEENRREMWAVFCLFDRDNSGCVSREEMANLLLALTHDLDDTQLGRLMDDLVGEDPACSEITFDQFLAWCHTNMSQCTYLQEHLVEEIFQMVDVDKSGYITVDEFIVVFHTLGHSLDHDDVRELVCQMDRNADGKIDLEEFARMLRKVDV